MDSSTQIPIAQPRSSPSGDSTPARRAKRSLPEDVQNGMPAKQSKACANCRRMKVRCDVLNRASNEDCSRCTRLQLTCLRERKQWSNAAIENAEPLQRTITKLERALEDILERLDMPALDLYTSPAIFQPRAPPQQTGPNFEEGSDAIRARDVSPDPISNLIEATRLNGLRSQLRSVKQRRKGGMRRKDHDLISEGLLGVIDAEELLELFQQHQAHHLFSAGTSSNATVKSLRASSTVLFTAVILVAALLVPGKEALHENIHSHFMGVVSSVMWDRFHTLDDIRGLVIAAFWQPYLSWKLSGLSIRMATELNLHHAFYTAFSDPDCSDEERRDCVEKTRLWYLLYVLDHQFSIAYGRPPCMNELRPIKDFDLLLRSEICTESDGALIAQVTNLAGLGRASSILDWTRNE
ncbi:hypothetical protein AC579_10090 [Pseudocercospora musae]|uniref:Zn(2)-C6 fungal-type domain-containing protein n=1 Tax=Pseudocercospora musae TaxID=113226 RepID=A0A139IG13_9PEZI|nr:hypothetical protein AC579_10090 [Pseudocercospora musae]